MSCKRLIFKQPKTFFKNLSNSYKSVIITQLISLFYLFAGDNINSFLYFLCKRTFFGQEYILPIFFETISKPILLNILALYNGSLARHKASILSLVASEFSLKFLIDFGFPITQRQYLYAQQKKKTVMVQPYIQAIPKSKEKLSETIIKRNCFGLQR